MSSGNEPGTGEPGAATPGLQSGVAGEQAAPDQAGAADQPGTQTEAAPTRTRSRNMLPGRERRRFGAERLIVRLIATCGVIGIGVLLGAILASSKVQGWIIGLVVGGVSVVLSAILWSSRQL